MLFIHFLRQEQIDIGHGDLFKRPPSLKQLNEEWAHRTAAAFNRSRRKTSVFFHEASEFGQHLVVDRYRFGWNLETVEKGQPSSRLCHEVFPRTFGMPAFRPRPVVTRSSACRFFDLQKHDCVVGPLGQSQILCD
jgi:hypothetical protein